MVGYSYEEFIEQIDSDNREEFQLDGNRIASALGLGRKVNLTYICPADDSDLLPQDNGAIRIKDLRMIEQFSKAVLWKLDSINVVDAVFEYGEFLWFASEQDAEDYETLILNSVDSESVYEENINNRNRKMDNKKSLLMETLAEGDLVQRSAKNKRAGSPLREAKSLKNLTRKEMYNKAFKLISKSIKKTGGINFWDISEIMNMVNKWNDSHPKEKEIEIYEGDDYVQIDDEPIYVNQLVDESLTEDRSLAKAIKKDIKRDYKNFDRRRDFIRNKNAEMEKKWQGISGKPMDDVMKDILLDKEPDNYKYRSSYGGDLEESDYPFYVTFYREHPFYHPEEGGYYIAGRYADYSEGFDSRAEARQFAKELADKEGLERVGSDYYNKHSKYIGEDEHIWVETAREYLSHERGDQMYESFKRRNKRALREKLVDAPQEVVDRLLEILEKYGFVLDPEIKHENPIRSKIFGNVHVQVYYPEAYVDPDDELEIEDTLNTFISRNMIDEIDRLDEETNCPITWNFGVDNKGRITGGLDVMKQSVNESIKRKSRRNLREKLVEAPQEVVDELLQILENHGFVLDDSVGHENPFKTLFDAVHIQVINPDSFIDTDGNIRAQLQEYVTRDLIDEIHELEDRTDCPITWSFGPNRNNQVTGGLDIDKQYVAESFKRNKRSLKEGKLLKESDSSIAWMSKICSEAENMCRSFYRFNSRTHELAYSPQDRKEEIYKFWDNIFDTSPNIDELHKLNPKQYTLFLGELDKYIERNIPKDGSTLIFYGSYGLNDLPYRVASLKESLKEEHIADKIRAGQDTKEMTRRAIKTLRSLGGESKDLEKEFKDKYGHSVDESLRESKEADIDDAITQTKKFLSDVYHRVPSIEHYGKNNNFSFTLPKDSHVFSTSALKKHLKKNGIDVKIKRFSHPQLTHGDIEFTVYLDSEKNESLKERYADDAVVLTAPLRKKLNNICQKYSGWHLPKEIAPMWDELYNLGIEVLIMGPPNDNAPGAKSWTVPFTLNGEQVENSRFVYSVYEGSTGLRNEYNMYFS